MPEGYWIYEEVAEHQAYYDAVPMHLAAEVYNYGSPHDDAPPARRWAGEVTDVEHPNITFENADDGELYVVRLSPAKDANKLKTTGRDWEVVEEKCWLVLQPLAEADHA